MAETNFVNVKIQVGKTTQNVQMEKGCMFQNKGGSYCVFEDGSLKFQKAGTDKWENAGQINMTSYQWKAFQNVADNDGKSSTFSQKDILKAQEKFKQGEFKADMSKDLPAGYKIEHPKMSSAEKSVEVDVTNGKETQSAKLKFQIKEMQDIKNASQSKSSYIGFYGEKIDVVTKGNTVIKTKKDEYGDKYVAEYKNNKLYKISFIYHDYFDGGEPQTYTNSWLYDDKGRIKEINEHGKRSAKVEYNKDGSFVLHYGYDYEYDKSGHLRRTEFYDGIITYEVDDDIVIKSTIYNRGNGSIQFEKDKVEYLSMDQYRKENDSWFIESFGPGLFTEKSFEPQVVKIK